MPDAMLHIASAVVKARPVVQEAVAARIYRARRHRSDRGGTGPHHRVVLEASQHRALADTLDSIAGLDGVLSATLVFEHSEPGGNLA